MYTQLDERWANIPLGQRGGETIGTAGCLLTLGAEMLTEDGNCMQQRGFLPGIVTRLSLGMQLDPGTLNRWLCRNNGYKSGNLIVFAKLGERAGLGCEVIDCANIAAPMDKVQITLDAGGYPIVKVDFQPGGVIQQHWVRILELTDDDALVHDPWLPDGGPYWLMARYGHWAWKNVARAVYRMALYTKQQRSTTTTNLNEILGAERRYFPESSFYLATAQYSLSPHSRSIRTRLAARARGLRRRIGR